MNLYDISDSIVVIIDVLRATSTIATALYNGAKEIIPVDSVAECIKLGKQMEVITAGERDGQIAEGLQYGNTPFQYTPEFIKGKTWFSPLPMARGFYTWRLRPMQKELLPAHFVIFQQCAIIFLHKKKM